MYQTLEIESIDADFSAMLSEILMGKGLIKRPGVLDIEIKRPGVLDIECRMRSACCCMHLHPVRIR